MRFRVWVLIGGVPTFPLLQDGRLLLITMARPEAQRSLWLWADN